MLQSWHFYSVENRSAVNMFVARGLCAARRRGRFAGRAEMPSAKCCLRTELLSRDDVKGAMIALHSKSALH